MEMIGNIIGNIFSFIMQAILLMFIAVGIYHWATKPSAASQLESIKAEHKESILALKKFKRATEEMVRTGVTEGDLTIEERYDYQDRAEMLQEELSKEINNFQLK